MIQLRKLRGRKQQKRLQVVILQRNGIFTGLGIQKNLGQYFGFLKLKSVSSVNNLHVVSKFKNMKNLGEGGNGAVQNPLRAHFTREGLEMSSWLEREMKRDNLHMP